MKLTKQHPLFNTFLSLSCKLSPENLSCDGECSRAEINKRFKALNKQWKEAEAKAGFEVTENDVWDAELANRA